MFKILLSITGIIYVVLYTLFNTYGLIKTTVRYTKLNVECTTLARAISECTKLYTGIILEHMANTYREAYVVKANERLDEYIVRDECIFNTIKSLFICFVVIGIVTIIWA